jgi:transmembrane sensor
MIKESDAGLSITEQAAHWWVVFHDGDASMDDHREFREWVVRSPERVEAYIRIALLNRALKPSGVRWPETPVETLVRESIDAPPDVTPLSDRSAAYAEKGRRNGNHWGVGLLVGLAAALLVSVSSAWFVFWRPLRLETKFGEQASFLLDDGSRVTLNSASKIEVRLRRDRRVVRLVAGEALFEVAHDATRPFEVRAGDATLQAKGTQFDVDMRPARTTVTVTEGQVAVLSADQRSAPGMPMPTLEVADQLVITPTGSLVPRHGVNVAAALSWTLHKLIFEHRSVGDVAEEFNRYNRKRIKITSAELRDQEITGTFASNDTAAFLGFLSSIPGVQIRDDGNGNHVVTLGKNAPSGP